MHLLDIPKPKRFPHGRYIVASSLVFAACAATPLLCRPRPRPVFSGYALGYTLAVPAKETSPMKYVTVTTTTFLLAHPCYRETPCISRQNSTWEKPLMELYDELCKVEIEARHHAGTFQGAELFSFQADKEFAKKYGLTLGQVVMIKRDGYRIKQETEKQP